MTAVGRQRPKKDYIVSFTANIIWGAKSRKLPGKNKNGFPTLSPLRILKCINVSNQSNYQRREKSIVSIRCSDQKPMSGLFFIKLSVIINNTYKADKVSV